MTYNNSTFIDIRFCVKKKVFKKAKIAHDFNNG